MQNCNSKFKIDISRRSYEFSLRIIHLSDSLPNNKRSIWIINDQLVRSATSIGANIIEAKASTTRLEFKKYYEIALRSANETRYWLELLRDSQLVNENVNELLTEVIELSKMLGAGVIKLKAKN